MEKGQRRFESEGVRVSACWCVSGRLEAVAFAPNAKEEAHTLPHPPTPPPTIPPLLSSKRKQSLAYLGLIGGVRRGRVPVLDEIIFLALRLCLRLNALKLLQFPLLRGESDSLSACGDLMLGDGL